MEVDHDRVRPQLLRELDRREPVAGAAHDRQLRLGLDQRHQGLDEGAVVVCEEDSDRPAAGLRLAHQPGS